MPWRCLVATLLGMCGARQALCDEFPYVAYVNSSDVYVRSGPGRNYYPTDKLPKGEKVEVYRHDPGGWYAIRPPRQSFSWVSTRHLDPVEDRLAVVNSGRVVARVGSAFSDVRDVIQIRLDKGEKVELIEPPSAESPWCKIAPPSGEFRWIFSKFVERDAGPDVADGQRDPARQREVRLASDEQQAEPQARPASGTPAAKDISSEDARQRELERVDLELSAMVVEEINVWSFAPLRQRAEAVLVAAQTPAERGQARTLVNKLARFEDIKQRHDAMRSPAADSEAGGNPAVAAPPRRAVDPRFDGVGRLAPVVSQRPGAPQFALVDTSNVVVSFVTPAPGVNLRPYVNKYVGVNGQRAYMTDLQREHISVQRVTMVDVKQR